MVAWEDMTPLQRVGFQVLSRLPYPEIFKLAKCMLRDHQAQHFGQINPGSMAEEEMIDRLVELELSHYGKRAQGNRYVEQA